MRKFTIIIAIVLLALAIAGCQQDVPPVNTQQPAPQAAPQPSGPPTYVAEGKTPEEHVKAYFDAYKEGRLEDAFKLAPAENKAKQPKDSFVSTRKGMPITTYKILPVKTQGDKVQVEVEYDIGQFGTWVSSWEFQKKGDKWEAVRYLASTK